MLNLMKPKYFIPVHGEYRMQKAHARLAKAVGISEERTFLIDKGEVIEFRGGAARPGGKVPYGNILIDGLGIGDVGNIVLRDRRLLSQDGILIAVVTLNKATKTIAAGPEIISRGSSTCASLRHCLRKQRKWWRRSSSVALNRTCLNGRR
ncbi:Ribonuclease J 2 [Geobacillus sp. BCO2]|nr:Ribonuclease J 2 [Geobacillus sp. BCO2]